MIDFYKLIIGILVVWRITHLLAYEEGPFNAIQVLREGLKKRYLERVLTCFYCLSLWVALPCTWLMGSSAVTAHWATWLAYSGGAIILERWSTLQKPSYPMTPLYWEDKENSS